MQPIEEKPEVNSASAESDSQTQSKSNTEGNGIFVKVVAGALVLGGIALGVNLMNQGPASLVQDAKTDRLHMKVEYSYEQFMETDVEKINGKISLPVKIEKMSPILVSDLEEEKSTLRDIKVYDFLESDGDVVEISVNNLRLGFFNLTNAEQVIPVPFYKDGGTQILVKAVDDGGGGVTFAMKGSGREFKTKVMQVGEQHSWIFGK
ncbi:MAG: hypothetical protein KC478_17090 [Bacteriovoracaceae bacterium]|nr:hypothetical protein [Bacteriovoracaceae bacterium]